MNFRRPAKGNCVAGKSREKHEGRVGERIVRLRDMQAAASIALLLMSGWTQPAMAQQQTNPPTNPVPTTQPPQTSPTAPAPPQAVQSDTTGQPGLPQAPAPKLTEPLYLRDTSSDYTKPKSHIWNPIAPYTATNVPPVPLMNTTKLTSLLQDGKIYLSLADAVALGLENNYDIAIARINLDIADTDILRAKAGFTNTRVTTNNPFSNYSPSITTNFRATATQHLLQGFGPWLNGRFVIQAKNDRRITDSSFRQQVLYTINQVEKIYWALVSAYEDEQAKERALAQSTQLAADNRKQLEIGTLAPLDVVNSDSAVASDKQALVASQVNLEYQQLLMKQAIARNLNDPQLSAAPVIPTDRVSLERIPEEDLSPEDLVKQAYANNPQIEQAVMNMKNNEITIKAFKNGLLPTVDAYAFYGANALGGAQNPGAINFNTGQPYPPGTFPEVSYGTAFGNLFNGSAPDKGVGVNINITLRNRTAQADQARSQMELRQSQMRLQQLYAQIRIQVINQQFAITSDRARVVAAQAARDYAAQSLDAEEKKYRLGASTTTNVLQQGRNLATAENNLISGTAAYADDRALLMQLLADTLERYGISIVSAATGTIGQTPVIPGLTTPKPPEPPKPISVTPNPPPQ